MYGKLSAPRAIPDRDAETRLDPRAVLADERGRYLLVQRDSVPVDGGLVFLTREEIIQLGVDKPSYLGRVGDVPYFAVDASGLAVDEVWQQRLADLNFVSLRLMGHQLGDADAALAMSALALVNWHATGFCPRCGAPTEVTDAGWQMRCESGHALFPRTDPAVIMLIHDADERVLLGRGRSWPAQLFSTLAGFVEAGEALEDAVRREVMEETGVGVGRLEYFGSQPWPYPRSLMIGFHGWTNEPRPRVVPDGREVVEADFFTREQVRERYAADRRFLPGPTSVARALIEDWLGGPLEEAE